MTAVAARTFVAPKGVPEYTPPDSAGFEHVRDTLLTAADRAWAVAAPLAPYGPRVRWRHASNLLREQGFPLRPYRRRLRDNLLTVPWSAVAPLS